VTRRQTLFVLIPLALMPAAPAQKRKGPKPPDLEVVEASAHRSAGMISLDGRVRNTGERPIRGLVLVFDFLAPDKVPLTTQKAQVDEEVLEVGKEAVFRMALNDSVRAVEFRINAVDQNNRDLRVARPGPFPIE
jgi:hypothetical protein